MYEFVDVLGIHGYVALMPQKKKIKITATQPTI